MRVRSAVVVLGVAGSLVLAGCSGGGSGAGPAPERTSITAPATETQTAVDQQNQQLREMEQRSSQDDPTVP